MHIDGWREITQVEGYQVTIAPEPQSGRRLFFVNLGGYTAGKLEEQHYTLLSVQDDRMSALKASKLTDFFKAATIKGKRC